MLCRNEPTKHLELTKRKLELQKRDKDMDGALAVLDWLASDEGQQFYRSVDSLASPIALVCEQIALLEPFDAAQIIKEVDAARTRLGADPVAVLIERAELRRFQTSRLNSLYRRVLSFASPDESVALDAAEKLMRRLFRIALSDHTETETERLTAATELFALTDQFPCAFSSHITRNRRDIAEYDLAIGPASPTPHQSQEWIRLQGQWDNLTSPCELFDVLEGAHAANEHDQVLKMERVLVACLDKWEARLAAVYPHMRRHLQVRRLQATIQLGCLDDALELLDAADASDTLSETELLSEALFDGTLRVLEHTKNHTRAISLIKTQLARGQPEEPTLLLRLTDNLLHVRSLVEAADCAAMILVSYPHMNDASRARAMLYAGLAAWNGGRRDGVCLGHFLAAAKADPTQAASFHHLAKYYWRMERGANEERARKCASKALSLDPRSTGTAVLLAEMLLHNCAHTQTRQLLDPVSCDAGQLRNRRLHYYHGIALFHLDDFVGSASALQTALKGAPSSDDDDTDPPVTDEMCLVWLAESFFRAGRLASALKAFARARDTAAMHSPARRVAVAGLAAVHVASGNLIDAVNVLDADEEEKDALDGCSSTLDSQRDKLTLDRMEAHLLLAKNYVKMGRFQAACQLLARAIAPLVEQRAPEDCAVSWRVAAECFVMAGELRDSKGFDDAPWETTRTTLVPRLTIDSGLEEVRRVVDSLTAEPLLQSAALFAMNAVSLATHRQTVFWLELAAVLLRLHSHTNNPQCCVFAIAATKNALQTDCLSKDAARAHQLLATAHDLLNDKRRTQHHLVRSLHIAESPSGWIALARFYQRNGDLELAQEGYKRALALDPDDQLAAFELAEVSETQGHESAALEVARRVFSAQPAAFIEAIAVRLATASTAFNDQSIHFARLLLHARHASDPFFANLLALSLEEEGQLGEALALLSDDSHAPLRHTAERLRGKLAAASRPTLQEDSGPLAEEPSSMNQVLNLFQIGKPEEACRMIALLPSQAPETWKSLAKHVTALSADVLAELPLRLQVLVSPHPTRTCHEHVQRHPTDLVSWLVALDHGIDCDYLQTLAPREAMLSGWQLATESTNKSLSSRTRHEEVSLGLVSSIRE